MLIRPLMTNFKMTVREDRAVSECSPFPLSIKALAYWLAVEEGISLWIRVCFPASPPWNNLASLLLFEWRVARPHFQLHWDLGGKHCARYWGEKEEWGRCPMLWYPAWPSDHSLSCSVLSGGWSQQLEQQASLAYGFWLGQVKEVTSRWPRVKERKTGMFLSCLSHHPSWLGRDCFFCSWPLLLPGSPSALSPALAGFW